MPCMLPSTVTNRALDELVAYRRIKNRGSNVCRQCVEESKLKVKRCVGCNFLYDDEHGRLEDDEEEMANTIAQLKEELEAQKG